MSTMVNMKEHWDKGMEKQGAAEMLTVWQSFLHSSQKIIQSLIAFGSRLYIYISEYISICWYWVRKILICGSGRSPAEGNGNPLQYSYLGHAVDRGAWWATVSGVAKEADRTEPLSSWAQSQWNP